MYNESIELDLDLYAQVQCATEYTGQSIKDAINEAVKMWLDEQYARREHEIRLTQARQD